jgi:hypothetical protein
MRGFQMSFEIPERAVVITTQNRPMHLAGLIPKSCLSCIHVALRATPGPSSRVQTRGMLRCPQNEAQ